MRKNEKPKGASKKKSGKKNSIGQGADITELEAILNFKFTNQGLLKSALTHSSTTSANKNNSKIQKLQDQKNDENNERLEFLGDRVLGLSISSLLIKLYPGDEEGDLARRYNHLVRRETCTIIAKDLDLGKYLILSLAEERSGGREKATILANAMEALLGAVFLDKGYEAADKIIRNFWQEQISKGVKVSLDAKTALQEWAQGQGLALPQYNQLGRTGPDHNPIFETSVLVEGVGEASGKGSSKRIAEQMAAKNLLEKQKVWPKE